jgi:hypothetical protein
MHVFWFNGLEKNEKTPHLLTRIKRGMKALLDIMPNYVVMSTRVLSEIDHDLYHLYPRPLQLAP